MIILDTQPVSQLQRAGHRTLLESNNGSTPIPPRTSGSRSSRLSSSSNLFLTVYSSIFLQNRGLRDHKGGVAPGAASPPGVVGSTC